jgi:hypothetical protein
LRQPPNDAIKVQLQLQLSAASEQATAWFKGVGKREYLLLFKGKWADNVWHHLGAPFSWTLWNKRNFLCRTILHLLCLLASVSAAASAPYTTHFYCLFVCVCRPLHCPAVHCQFQCSLSFKLNT